MPGVGKFEEVPPSGLRLVLANAIVEGPISTIDTFLTQSEGSQGSDQKIVVIDSFEALKRFHLQLKGNPDLWGTISGIHMLVGLREASGTLTHVMTHLMNMAIMREQNTGQPMAAILDVVSKCDDAMQAALVHQRVIISGNRTFKSATDGDPFVLPPPIPPSQEVLQLLSD